MTGHPLSSEQSKTIAEAHILNIQAKLIELAHDAILVRNPASTIISWNRGAEKLYGWTAQEAIGKVTHSLLQTRFPQPLEAIDALLATGEQWEGELVHTRRDGTQIIVESRQVLVRDEQGEPMAILEINREITNRKQRERENEEQERFLAEVSKLLASTLDYQETLANIAQLVVPQLADWFSVDLLNAEGGFELIELRHKDPEQIQWARALREQFPIDPNAPTGLPHIIRSGQSELYPEITDEMLVALTKTEKELAIARQVGYTSAMSVPLVARGKTIGVVSFVATESGQRYDERSLALAEEVGRRAGIAIDNALLHREVKQAHDQLDIILQGVADGIIVYDKSNHIIYANEAAARVTGFTSKQKMLAMPALDILAKYEIIDEQGQPFPHNQLPHLQVFARKCDVQATIGYTNTATGHLDHWSLVASSPVFNAEGEIIYAITIIHDITERILSERRKDEFISMASHELKTPVTSLKGFTYVLQRRLSKQGDEQGLHYLSRMDMQLNKLTKLIGDLLDMSRMQTGQLDLQKEAFALDALIQETVENVQAASSSHQLLIEGRIEARIFGDKDRLGQVLVNLLTNAIKYSPKANKVIVRLFRDEENALVSIQDFGIGIDEVYHRRVFERFYQVTDPEEKTYPGLGVGLYISGEIVERHQGRLWVESKKGQGATFSLALPLLKES